MAAAAAVAGIAISVTIGGNASAAVAPAPSCPSPSSAALATTPKPLIATRILLDPGGVTTNAGCPVTLTAHLFDWKGNALPGPRVAFSILDGPNAGAALSGTQSQDKTTWSVQLSSSKPGVDVVQATFIDGLEVHRSNRAFVEWHTGPPATPIRSPAALQVSPGCFQPAVSEIRASDTLKSVKPKKSSAPPAPETSTITVSGTDFNPFTAVLITFDAGPGGKPQNFSTQTDGFGAFRRDIQVTEPAEGTHLIRADDFREREAQTTYRLPCAQGTVALDPPIGPPGFVTTIVGRNFPPNSKITFLNWTSPDLASPFPKGSISTDSQGSFQFPILILYHDLLGPRTLRAVVQDALSNDGNALIAADAPFLVTLGRAQPDDFVQRR